MSAGVSAGVSVNASAAGLQVQLDHLVQASPQEAVGVARQHLGPEWSVDHRTLAWTAIGRALYELGDPARAMAAMRRALAAGRQADTAFRLGALISSAPVAAEVGETDLAHRVLDEAEQLASGATLGRVRTQRAFVLQHLGRPAEALTVLASVEPLLHDDPLAMLRLTVNRAMIRLQLADTERAEHDLRRAARDADRLGQQVIAAGVISNLAYARAQSDDLARALTTYDEAERRYVAAGRPARAMAVLEIDRAAVLQRAGLHGEAMRAAAAAVLDATASGSAIALGDAQLCLARARLAAGRSAPAVRAARDAATTFRRAGRAAASMLARAVQLEAELAGAAPGSLARLSERARRLSARLTALGWGPEAAALEDARWRAAWTVTGRPPERCGPATEDPGDTTPTGSWRALHRRLVAAGDPQTVLEIAAGAARSLPVTAGAARAGAADVVIGAALALGRAEASLEWAEVRRGAVPPGGPVRATSGVLVRYLLDRGSVWAVVVRARVRHVIRLGPQREVLTAVRRLVAALEQTAIATGQGSGPGSARESGPLAAAAAADDVAALLCPPLPGRGPVVVVACPELHGIPWMALPALAGRNVTVASTPWAGAAAPPGGSAPRVTFVAGPDLRSVALERRSVAAAHGRLVAVTGARATPQAVRRALGRSGIVHIAAHGEHDPAHPDGVAMRLAGASLSARELAQVTVRADVVVMTVCAAGAAQRLGTDATGLADILLRGGAGAVVAPVAAVGHEAAAEFAGAFHGALADGASPSEAVRRAGLFLRSNRSRSAPGASAFVCFTP